jgi:hypothetical protein
MNNEQDDAHEEQHPGDLGGNRRNANRPSAPAVNPISVVEHCSLSWRSLSPTPLDRASYAGVIFVATLCPWLFL